MGTRHHGHVRSYDSRSGLGELRQLDRTRLKFKRADLEDPKWVPEELQKLSFEIAFWSRRPVRIRRETGSVRTDEHPLFELAAFAVGALLVGAAIVAFARLADQTLSSVVRALPDPEPVVEEAARRFEEESPNLTSLTERLDRVDALLEADSDEISTDQAAMLVSATLEAGVRELARLASVETDSETQDGLVTWAIALHSAGRIAFEELKQIKHHVWQVRNRVMHGDFDGFSHEHVAAMAQFTRRFLQNYSLA